MDKIKASMILQMIGKPKEHLIDTMEQLLNVIGAEKGIKLANKSISEPKEVENKNEKGDLIKMREDEKLFSAFSDIDIEAESVKDIFRICFKYMPAHVEIFEPEKIELKNVEINPIINEILLRLHNYDSVVKSALMNNQMLTREIEELSSSKEKNSKNKKSNS